MVANLDLRHREFHSSSITDLFLGALPHLLSEANKSYNSRGSYKSRVRASVQTSQDMDLSNITCFLPESSICMLNGKNLNQLCKPAQIYSSLALSTMDMF
jgi:hypothetical protein